MQKLHRPVATAPIEDRAKAEETPLTRCVLVVGELSPETLPTQDDQTVVFATPREITADLLSKCRPHLVLSQLVGIGFDCMDVGERLSQVGFTGRFRAVADKLPDPAVVRREIRGHFPDLDFDILVLS